jgi:two-component system, NarL family, response regulator NreC
MSTRILLVDDHQMMREGLRALLEGQAGVSVVGEAEDGRQAVEMVDSLKPDVVIMDVTMPSLNGVEATRQILGRHPDVKVIALSIHSDQRFVRQMFEVGAAAYLLKEGAFDELTQAIRAVRDGESYISSRIAGAFIKEYVRPGARRAAPGAEVLSARENEVLQLIAEGKSTKEIASILRVGVKTVETHRRQVMLKLQINSVAELTKYAIRVGLTTL